jgi:hypothetical protein
MKEINIRILHQKDKTKILKRVMWVTADTGTIGLDKITTVAELPNESILAKEIDWICDEMVKLKKKDIGEENKKKVVKKKLKI